MQRLCSEPGVWPESIEQLRPEELDSLIEHAADCSYHLAILDHDEEEFLTELTQTWGLIFAPERNSRTTSDKRNFLAGDIEWNLPIDGLASNESTPNWGTRDSLYDGYRRWSDQRCPLEMLQIRYGDRTLCTFDVTREGGSWRLEVKKGDGVLQFWTFCRRHQDRVRIAACDLPQCDSVQPEASTLSFRNGQSLSLMASRIERDDFSVLVHCTAPRTSHVRYAVYNFDSLIDYSGSEAGREHCKSSQIVRDFAKFAELRFPVRDLEAAQLVDGLPREKCVDELIRVMAEESFEEIEALEASCTTESEKLLEDQEDQSNRPTQIVTQLKNWIKCQNFRHKQLYRFSRRVTALTIQNYLIQNLPALENEDHDKPVGCLAALRDRDDECFLVDGDSLNFVLVSRESLCGLNVTKSIRRQNTSAIYRTIEEYCARFDSESRRFAGTGVHEGGKFSKLLGCLPLHHETVSEAISTWVKAEVVPFCFYEGLSVVTSVTSLQLECKWCSQISLERIYEAAGSDKINATYGEYAPEFESQYFAKLPMLAEKRSTQMLPFISDLSCLTS